MHSEFDDDFGDDRPPSKTRIKKALLELQDMALALIELPESRLAAIDMDERLREALDELKRLKAHSARKRHIKFVAKLLRDEDLTPFRQALDVQQADRAQAADRLHEVEAWRERLLADDDALADWVAQHPASDTRQFRSLVKNARIERTAALAAAERGQAARKGKTYRELFRHLRDALGADS